MKHRYLAWVLTIGNGIYEPHGKTEAANVATLITESTTLTIVSYPWVSAKQALSRVFGALLICDSWSFPGLRLYRVSRAVRFYCLAVPRSACRGLVEDAILKAYWGWASISTPTVKGPLQLYQSP